MNRIFPKGQKQLIEDLIMALNNSPCVQRKVKNCLAKKNKKDLSLVNGLEIATENQLIPT